VDVGHDGQPVEQPREKRPLVGGRDLVDDGIEGAARLRQCRGPQDVQRATLVALRGRRPPHGDLVPASWKKSTASVVVACVRRNCRHVVSVCRDGAEDIRRSLRIRRVVDAPTRWSSLSSSPGILL
jgi:hypothetical protein